jgi:MFS family permease
MGLPTFPKIYNTYFVAFVATVGGMLFGFDISSMSAIIGTQQYNDFFDKPAGVRQGTIGSALAAGSVVGSIIAGPVSNKIGRRDSIMFACIFWLIGTAVQVGVNGWGMLVAGRIINGITVGITSSQVPVYLGEIARKEKRGSLIIIQQLAIGTYFLAVEFAGALTISRMGYPDHVLHWLWLQLHRWASIIPNRLGHSVCPLRLPHAGSAVPAKVSSLAGEGRPRRRGYSEPCPYPGWRRCEPPACRC